MTKTCPVGAQRGSLYGRRRDASSRAGGYRARHVTLVPPPTRTGLPASYPVCRASPGGWTAGCPSALPSPVGRDPPSERYPGIVWPTEVARYATGARGRAAVCSCWALSSLTFKAPRRVDKGWGGGEPTNRLLQPALPATTGGIVLFTQSNAAPARCTKAWVTCYILHLERSERMVSACSTSNMTHN